MANIAAGYGADEAVCLARGFDRAAQAAAGLSSLLHLAIDLRLLDQPNATRLLERSLDLSQMIRGWQRAIREHEAVRMRAIN